MGDIWLAPYIPVSEEAVVGPWVFVPFRAFSYRHARGPAVFNEARRLVTAYKLDGSWGTSFGAVVLPKEGRVGDELPRELLPRLWRALVPALIDLNPSFLEQDEQRQPSAGHAMASADNAQVYGHPLTGQHSYVISQGAMVTQLGLFHAPPGRRLPRIPPPPGLPKPILGRGLDEEYAAALYAALVAGDTTARRLDRSIQWQVLAWSNTEVIAEDARVLAFRAAFDVLLGGGSQTRKHGRALATLLADTSEPRRREWTEHGKSKVMELNETEWWFQSFALLRNAIAHGDVIGDKQWLFDDGGRHLWHADDMLRRALKRTVVAVVGDEDLELKPVSRHFKRAREQLEARWAEQDQPAGPPTS